MRKYSLNNFVMLYFAMTCVVAVPSFCQGLFGNTTSLSDTNKTAKDTIWRDTSSYTAKPDSNQVVRYEKRQFDHQQQVVVGGVVMLCVILVLVGMNNYNPRR